MLDLYRSIKYSIFCGSRNFCNNLHSGKLNLRYGRLDISTIIYLEEFYWLHLQKETKRKLPCIVDIAYEQYKRDLPLYRMANELMSSDVVTITPEASLDEAAQVMGEKHIGSLIVVKYKTPVGIVTERDLLSKVLAYGTDFSCTYTSTSEAY